MALFSGQASDAGCGGRKRSGECGVLEPRGNSGTHEDPGLCMMCALSWLPVLDNALSLDSSRVSGIQPRKAKLGGVLHWRYLEGRI